MATLEEQTLKTFFKKANDYKSICLTCKGSGEKKPAPTLDEVLADTELIDTLDEPCGGCDGNGWVNRLATMLDLMLGNGATPLDLHDWLGPLFPSTEKTIPVIDCTPGNTVHVQCQGQDFEGVIRELELDQSIYGESTVRIEISSVTHYMVDQTLEQARKYE